MIPITKIRIPNGAAGTHSGWYTFVRGAKVPRRAFLSVLIGGYRGKIESIQSQDPCTFGFEERRGVKHEKVR